MNLSSIKNLNILKSELKTLVETKPRSFKSVLKSKKYEEIYKFINNLTGKTFNDKLFLFYSNELTPPTCAKCENFVILKDGCISKGWNVYCSKGCATIDKNKNRYINDPTLIDRFRKSYFDSWHSNSANIEVLIKQDITRRQNNLEKYGVELTWDVPEIQKKCHENCMKQMHSYKIFTSSITNKIYKCRGYEHLAIGLLEKQNKEFIADDFYTPRINYDLLNKKRTYYPDIFIQSENKLIEVKSIYWLFKQYDKNKAIQYECLNQGYDFEFWVFDGNHNLSIINIV